MIMVMARAITACVIVEGGRNIDCNIGFSDYICSACSVNIFLNNFSSCISNLGKKIKESKDY